MAQYRAIHTKVIQSFDFNEMPDDFTRLTWVLLPLGVDSEGRGIYNGSWIKSKLYPMRDDITGARILEAMEYYIVHGMVVRYSVDGRDYFYIVNFKKYQRGLEKETKSVIPTPELVESNSGVSQELVESNSSLNANANTNTNANADADAGSSGDLLTAFASITHLPIPAIKAIRDTWITELAQLQGKGVDANIMRRAVKEITDKSDYQITAPHSIFKACDVVLARQKRKHDDGYVPASATEFAGAVIR